MGSPATATVLFSRCAHGAAPLVYSGPGLLCCPCVLEQKQTGSMDSDDFRALLISTGYSLVCSLCLPRCCAAPPLLPSSPSCPSSPSSSSCSSSRHPPPEFPGPRGHPSTRAVQPQLPPPPRLHLLGWGPSDDSLSLPPPFWSLWREEVRLWLSFPFFLFLSFFLSPPPTPTPSRANL